MRILNPHLGIICFKVLSLLTCLCVQLASLMAAQELDSEPVRLLPPYLIKDSDSSRHRSTDEAGGRTVPQLIRALKDPDAGVRANAAEALMLMGEEAKEAVPQLIEALKDPDDEVRWSAVRALGQIGEGAKGAMPQLIEALRDPDPQARRSAAAALDKLSTILVREKAAEYNEQIKIAAVTIRNSSDPEVRKYADRVQQASDLLKLLWWEQLKHWVVAHPTVSIAIAAYPLLLLT
jgi:hypothetical protein